MANMPEVFAQEEQRELEPGIFDVIAGDDLRFAFGQIERRAIGFGGRRDHEQDEPGKSPRRSTYQSRQAEPP